MIRQSSSKNQRSKGVRVKHTLQICMLLGVCFWLIYQVKHSYDKRKHFEESDSEDLGGKLQVFDEVIKLGRKDLHPRDEELSKNPEKIDDEEVEDEETLGKGDEGLEETQEELESKRKEEGSADIEALLDGTSRGVEAGERVGNDDFDEQDPDKAEKEADGDEDLIDGDKDVEKDEENETEEKDEDNEHQRGNDALSDDQDHDSSSERHEAREEHYKADDASSAVAHVGQNIISEITEHKNVNTDTVAQELGYSSDETEFGKEQHLNEKSVLENNNEATPTRLEGVLIKNVTNEASSENVSLTAQNEEGHKIGVMPEQKNTTTTEGLSDDKSSNTINGTEQSSTISSNINDANVDQGENSNATSQEFSNSDLVEGSNRTESFNTDEQEDSIQDRRDSEEDSILSSLNDDETLRDPLISEEEDKDRDSFIDLDTLPELRTEGTDSDDAATE